MRIVTWKGYKYVVSNNLFSQYCIRNSFTIIRHVETSLLFDIGNFKKSACDNYHMPTF